MRNIKAIIALILFQALCNNAFTSEVNRKLLTPHDYSTSTSIRSFNKSLDSIKSTIDKDGSAVVIIGLRVPFAGQGYLEAKEQKRQQADIKNFQTSFMSKNPSLFAGNYFRFYESIPFVAVRLDHKNFPAVVENKDIISISENIKVKTSLYESAPLVGMSNGSFSGYSGSGQTIAILDTGVHKSHSDLNGKVVAEACFSTAGVALESLCPNGINSTEVDSAMPYINGVCKPNECDHGTHVAAIAAGKYGIARGANIIAVQTFSWSNELDKVGTTAQVQDLISSLEYIFDLRNTYNIASVNMSLGLGYFKDQNACDEYHPAMKAIIDNLRSVGIASIIASGNEKYLDGINWPSCISSAVSVGATWDASFPGAIATWGGCTVASPMVDDVACFSNSVSFLNLLAPGLPIRAAIPPNTSTVDAGTSMAAPHVSGAWAVLKHKRPSATVTRILSALTNTGLSVTDSRNILTKKRIKVASAIQNIGTENWSVNVVGRDFGSVYISPPGLTCTGSCGGTWSADSTMTLTASPTSSGTFLGWSGDCDGFESCTIHLNDKKSVTATFSSKPTSTLSVAVNGTGSGNIVSNPAGINCPGTCSASFATNEVVALTQSPSIGSVFSGWFGSCSGDSACYVSMNSSTDVGAIFTAKPRITALNISNLNGSAGYQQRFQIDVPIDAVNLEISISGGAGDADLYVKKGTPPDLSTYDCRPWILGNEELCSVSSAGVQHIPDPPGTYYIMINGYYAYSGVTLKVSYVADPLLSVAKKGHGTITSSPAGIMCGLDCSEKFPPGTQVTLTALPASSSKFVGWSGSICTGSTPICSFTLSDNQTETAIFQGASITPILMMLLD